jgi:hypothetical protein
MRELTGHRVNGCNDKLVITAYEGSGPANATHRYVVTGYDIGTNEATDRAVPGRGEDALDILFQNGPIPEKGTNGVTQEVLLEIVIDRLRSFQASPFSCRENAIALTKIEEAKMWLQQRTRNRMERGVEGTHQK